MKSFQFPLEKVLVFRKRQWEVEAAALESLVAHRAALEAQRERMRASRELAARGIVAEGSHPGSRIAEFEFAQRCCRGAIRRLDIALASLAERIVKQQRVLVEARRNYELVLRLREKRYAQWLIEANRQEEAEATEGYLSRLVQRRLAVSSRMRVSARQAPMIPLRPAAGGDAC